MWGIYQSLAEFTIEVILLVGAIGWLVVFWGVVIFSIVKTAIYLKGRFSNNQIQPTAEKRDK